MKFDLSNKYEELKYNTYSDKLKEAGKKVELKAIREGRSIDQNKYLHVCISLYGIYFGSTILEAKTDLKKECDFMVYEKKGKKYLKETSKMDSKEVAEFIEWIRNYASQNGCYIPTADEYKTNKFTIDQEIDSHKVYL